MGLREDVKYMLNKDWEPKVPNEEVIQKQAEAQIKRGKSTGSVSMDMKAIDMLKHDDGER